MTDKTLLTGLCSICNTHNFKYCCPACSARTCSLPCYKRHQQWAQCSGKRDPTKFVKKSQLVTPAGIDHDFNFLSGIERDIQKAERTASATESPLDDNAASRYGRISYHRLETAGVKVIRAPQGMSRQRENKSHVSRTKRANKNIVWTVEWLDATKRRVLSETSSMAPLKNANPFSQDPHRHKSKKRKMQDDTQQNTNSTPTENSTRDTVNANDSPATVQYNFEPTGDPDGTKPPSPNQREYPTIQEQDERLNPGETVSNSNTKVVVATPAPEHGEQHHFYLVKPRTSSTRPVLIPLDSSQTLGENLRGRTVLEFPTIYVFPSSMAQLPEEYLLESVYLEQQGEEQKELDQLLLDLDPGVLKRLKEEAGPVGSAAEEEEVDSKRILDVLKQDLGGTL